MGQLVSCILYSSEEFGTGVVEQIIWLEPLIGCGAECQAELFESMPIAQPDDVQNVFGVLQNYFYCLLVFASPLKLMMQCPSPIWCSLISTKFGKNWSPVCVGELVMLR